ALDAGADRDLVWRRLDGAFARHGDGALWRLFVVGERDPAYGRGCRSKKGKHGKEIFARHRCHGDPSRVWALSFVSQHEASPRDERPCFDLFAEDEEVCYEAEIGNARFSLKYRRDKSSSWPDLSSGLTRGLSRPSTSLIF